MVDQWEERNACRDGFTTYSGRDLLSFHHHRIARRGKAQTSLYKYNAWSDVIYPSKAAASAASIRGRPMTPAIQQNTKIFQPYGRVTLVEKSPKVLKSLVCVREDCHLVST
jgi:hypothetical protein